MTDDIAKIAAKAWADAHAPLSCDPVEFGYKVAMVGLAVRDFMQKGSTPEKGAHALQPMPPSVAGYAAPQVPVPVAFPMPTPQHEPTPAPMTLPIQCSQGNGRFLG